jgi:hypothetical protein
MLCCVRAITSIMVLQPNRQVASDAGVVNAWTSFAYQNVNVMKSAFHGGGLPSRSLGALGKLYHTARLPFHFGVAALAFAALQAKAGPDWARTSDPALIKRML